MPTTGGRRSAEGAVTLPRHFRDTGYLTLGAGKLFHAHTFFDKKNLSGYPDPGAWHDYFPSKTQQMPEEAVPENWPVNSSRKFYRGHFDWAPLQIPNAEMADAKVVSWAAKRLAKRHEQPLFLSVGIYRPHVPWYAPQKYFDRFPLDEIQLPKHLKGDLGDVPAAGQKWPSAIGTSGSLKMASGKKRCRATSPRSRSPTKWWANCSTHSTTARWPTTR